MPEHIVTFSGDANTNFSIAMHLLQDHMSKIHKN